MDDSDRREHTLMFSHPVLSSTGHCHFCNKPTRGGALFCCIGCMHDWEHAKSMRGGQYCPDCGE